MRNSIAAAHEPGARSQRATLSHSPDAALTLNAEPTHIDALDLLRLLMLYRCEGAFTPDSWTL